MNRTEHLLWIVAEECAEVAQRASKAARFGLEEVQEGQTLTNARRIILEFGDLVGALDLLKDDGLINMEYTDISELSKAKKAKIEKFLHFSRKCGTLE